MIFAIDIETTGSNPSRDEIFNIGIVSIEGKEIKDSFEFFFKISHELSYNIEKLTKKNFTLLKNYPSFFEQSETIYEILNKATLIIAHNKSFDFKFLNAQFKRFLGKELTCQSFCTQEMVRQFLPDLISSNLKYLSTYFLQNSFATFHNALEDATLCAKIYLLFLREDFFPKNLTLYERSHDFFQIKAHGKPIIDLNTPELLLSSLLKNKISLEKFFPLQSQVFCIAVFPSLFFEEVSIYYPAFKTLRTYHISQKKLLIDLRSYCFYQTSMKVNFPYTIKDVFFISQEELVVLLDTYSFISWFYCKKTFYKEEKFFVHHLR